MVIAQHRVAVVTGGSRGIGAAIAAQLAAQNWTVHCVSRSGDVPFARDELAPYLVGSALDVRDTDAVVAFFAGTAPDASLLINCAGVHTEHDALTLPLEKFREVMAVNVEAPLLLSQRFAAARDGRPGVIINLGSFFEEFGVPSNLAYSASKAAVASMTRTLAVEWGRKAISVVNVAPGYVETDINRDYLRDTKVAHHLSRRIPRGGPASADDVAELVLSISAPVVASQFTGHTLVADGGQIHRL